MTDTNDFDDAADFDISKIVQDIDAANLALDSLDGRTNKLTETLQALLKAQSQPNPFANVEPAPQEATSKASGAASSTDTSSSTISSSSTASSETKPEEQSSSN